MYSSPIGATFFGLCSIPRFLYEVTGKIPTGTCTHTHTHTHSHIHFFSYTTVAWYIHYNILTKNMFWNIFTYIMNAFILFDGCIPIMDKFLMCCKQYPVNSIDVCMCYFTHMQIWWFKIPFPHPLQPLWTYNLLWLIEYGASSVQLLSRASRDLAASLPTLLECWGHYTLKKPRLKYHRESVCDSAVLVNWTIRA